MKKFRNLFAKVVFGIIILYSFIGFIILPYFIQFYIPTIVEKTIHSESYVDSVHINPFTFKIKVSNLIIKDQKKKNLLFFETLKINIDPLKLFLKEVDFSKIAIDNLKLAVDINKNKVINFQYILDSFNKDSNTTNTKTTEEKSDLLIKIGNLYLSNINFVFEDYSKEIPFIVQTKPISLFSTDIQLKPNHTNKINLVINTHNTGKLTLQSNIIVEPLNIDGNIALSQIAVNKIFNYVKPPNIDFTIDSQPIDISLDYHYKKVNQKQNITLENINLQLPQFLFTQNPFSIELQKLLHTTNKVELEVSDMLKYSVTNANSKIQDILFFDTTKNSSLHFTDFSNSIENISHNKQQNINITQSLHTPQNGTIQADIQAIQEPLSLDIKIDTQKIALKPYQAYIKEFANLDIKSALLSNNGKIKITNENNQTDINLQTNLSIKDINIFNSANNQQLFKVSTLKVSGMNYKNNNLFIKNINIEKPFIKFSINDNNTTNFSNLLPVNPKKKEVPKPKKDTQKFVYNIDTISIKNGNSLFEDKSVSPAFVSKDSKIIGDIKNISSNKNKQTVITHRSIIDNYAPLLINTNMILTNPTEALKTTVKVNNINLPSLSSYSGKFIGQKIANGKLNLSLECAVQKSQLQSKNNIRIKDIELGEKVESKDAINAPIGLAIALLEDSDGYIDLDIPIDGDLKNPNFHLSDVILDVITNTIVGIVSAPFKFLALLIGFDGDDISNVEFNYGSYEILITQKEKLDKILSAFTKRPNLKLKIKPSYVENEDNKVLQEMKFKEKYPFIATAKDNFDSVYKKITNIFIKEFSEKNYEALEGEKEDKYKTMISKLKNNIKVLENDLVVLATQRAQSIQTYLLSKNLDPSRIIIDENVQKSIKDLKIDKALVLFEMEVK